MGFKTLLFHNGDYKKQPPLRFSEMMKMPVEKIVEIFSNSGHRKNTGVFWMSDTLAKNLDAEWITSKYNLKESSADSVVTNALHAISPVDFVGINEYWMSLLDSTINVVPFSCGFRYPVKGNLILSGDLLKFLSAIAERNEIGVRGEYAADVLNKHGIRNVRIIGCPSLYYHHFRDFKIPAQANRKPIKQINFAFQTEFNLVSTPRDFYERHLGILDYFHKLYVKREIEVNWTLQWSLFSTFTSLNYFKPFNAVTDFLSQQGRYFFSADDWIEQLKQDDFSIGTTIHGNIAAINARVPALPIVIDKRMEEMCRWHKIPYIPIEDFDPNKPVEYYRELADYSEFNKAYASNFDNYLEYCRKNKVEIKPLEEMI